VSSMAAAIQRVSSSVIGHSSCLNIAVV
jgi:hypothetical protein